MQRVNEYRLYDLGASLHPFSEKIEGRKYSDVMLSLYKAGGVLHAMLQQNAEVPLRICRPHAQKVLSCIEAIVPSNFSEAIKRDSETPITWTQSFHLQQAVQEFETVLSAELLALDTYFVSQKGAYSTPDLIERAHIALPNPYRDGLSDDARKDFDQAGRCLAFDLGTATGFHLIRATEAVLRKYYQEVTGSIPKVKSRNWGAYIKWLRQSGANPKILKRLEEVKDDYRNPVLHPEDTLTPAEAIVMFGLCTGAIVQMMEEMDKLKAASALAALPLAMPSLAKAPATRLLQKVREGA